MYAKVELGYREMPGALSLPATTLRSSKDGAYVLVAGQGDVLEKVPCTLLMDDGAEVVLSAKELDPSSRVVLTAPPGIAQGQACNVREQLAKGAGG